MIHKLSVFLMPLVLIALLVGCTQTATMGTKPTVAETAASAKCVKDGGQDRVTYGPNGRFDLCLFNDGTVCEEGAYYNGKCHKGDCARKCNQIGTRSEGWYDCTGQLLFFDHCSNETAVTAGTC